MVCAGAGARGRVRGHRADGRLRPAPPRRARRGARDRGASWPTGTSSCRSTCRAFGGSALTGDIAVPKDGVGEGIPVTYVPARNTIFLSLALGLAEASGARDIFIGVNALDYSGYPDCRPEFIAEFERLANLATKAGVEGERFHHPRAAAAHDQGRHRPRGAAARARRGLSHSCYDPLPDGRHCGQCDACRLRAKGFAEAGLDGSDGVTHDLRGQGMLPDASGRGRAGGQPRGVPALCRVQSVVGARAGPRATRNAVSATPISSAPTARAAASSPSAERARGACRAPVGRGRERRLVVITGGEPMLQLDAALVDALHGAASGSRSRATGRLPATPGIDWLCVSPKAGTDVVQRSGDELKLVWPQDGIDPGRARGLGLRPFPRPADGLRGARGGGRGGDSRWRWSGRKWRLSLQAHKVVGLP